MLIKYKDKEIVNNYTCSKFLSDEIDEPEVREYLSHNKTTSKKVKENY